MTPLDLYRSRCENGLIIADSQQLTVIEHLQIVYQNLLHEHNQRAALLSIWRKPKLVPGLYIWGGVGVGKTFMLDCFYQCVPFNKKMRMHFHQFMQFVHQELIHHQGKKNPLNIIAKQFAQKAMLLCFDEFIVKDITDAMLLARLFKELFSQGVCLVTTSNTMPDDLYKHGLQRALFLPAIELIKQHTRSMHMPTTIDYRLRHLQTAGVFYVPNDTEAHLNMEKSFALLTSGKAVKHGPIELYGRPIKIQKQAHDVIWFDFNDICTVPRSQQDYLMIVKNFRTVFISNVPEILADAKNTISLFIRLIDVLYDARVRLVLSAAKSIEHIYTQGTLLIDYARTRSRLLEMQTEYYFLASS